jgi:pyruvate,water dikinase
MARLRGSAAAREFVSDLNAYLEEFGWRTDSIYELAKPAWREDPRIPLGTIKGYLNMGDEASPDIIYNQAVQRREHLLANARRKIAGDPATLRRFNEMYDAASSCMPIIEDHNHWIDQMGDIVMRYPSLDLGRRLVAKSSIGAVDDVFMLRVDEIKAGMQTGKNLRATVAERRRDMERFATATPPPVIGEPVFYGDPIEDVLGRFFGAPVKASEDASVVNGVGASPGIARGPAKIVRTLEEASKLRKGDVMVCEMTLPPWTPLFSTVSAVVADTGGILCHCAIVARECQLPCVVGTMVGTTVLKDGQIVTVDGTHGFVRIEPS